MQLLINEAEFRVVEPFLESRRSQEKCLFALWEIHHKQEAKRLLDSMPYSSGAEIPYVKKRERDGKDVFSLSWEPSGHLDLIVDLRELHEWMLRKQKGKRQVSVVYELLKRVEALSGDAYRTYTDELIDEVGSRFRGVKTYDVFAAECRKRADKRTTDVIIALSKKFPLHKDDERSAIDYLRDAIKEVEEIPERSQGD